MTRCLGLGFVLAGLLLALSGASAQDKKGKVDVEAIFKKLDKNSDGKLTRDEFLKLADRVKDKDKAREKLTSAFKTIDAEMKGYLSKDQFRTYLEKKKDESR